MLDPSEIDATEDGAPLFVQPIPEAARDDDARHVLYCSGHVPLKDGRILYVGGTDYPRALPITSPELGLDYSRVFDPFQRTVRDEDPWPEPTPRGYHSVALLLKDGRVLIGGGQRQRSRYGL